MIFDGSIIAIDVFCSADRPGSRQLLHLYDGPDAMRDAYEHYSVDDEFDHSFVGFESAGQARVYWRNKAGKIQFCGSAAYGLSWLALTLFDIPSLQITSRHINTSASFSTNASFKKGAVVMAMPGQTALLLFSDRDGELFFCPASGVYLLNATVAIEQANYSWLLDYLERKQLKNAQGFCVFAWQRGDNSGAMRYFVPWCGRIEDYVTGSIHQSLTPLVSEIYGVREQTWLQLSSSGGSVSSRCENGRVLISGQCRLAAQHEIACERNSHESARKTIN